MGKVTEEEKTVLEHINILLDKIVLPEAQQRVMGFCEGIIVAQDFVLANERRNDNKSLG